MLPELDGLKSKKAYVRDLAERVLWTFLMAAGGVAVAAGPANWVDVSMWKTAAIAGLAAAGSLLKGLVARYVRNPDSASTAKGV
jgi:hypothetical protein